MYSGQEQTKYYNSYPSENSRMQDRNSYHSMRAADFWLINTNPKPNLAPSTQNQKLLRMFIFPPGAERSVAEGQIIHTSQFFNTNGWFEVQPKYFCNFFVPNTCFFKKLLQSVWGVLWPTAKLKSYLFYFQTYFRVSKCKSLPVRRMSLIVVRIVHYPSAILVSIHTAWSELHQLHCSVLCST